MAATTDEKKLNGSGLRIVWGLIKALVPTKLSDLLNDNNTVTDANYVHTDNNYGNTDKTKVDGVESGAQVNVIETVKVNNVALSVSEKGVNIPVPTDNASLANGAGYQTAAQVNALIDSKVQSYITPKGSIAFAILPTPSSSNLGWMWNVTDAFTIDNRFEEYDASEAKSYPKGTNVYVIESTPAVDETPATYKFDVYQGFFDMDEFATQEDVEALSAAEIRAICV